MKKTKFPSIANVAAALRAVNASVEGASEDADNGGGVDVRLRVQHDGWNLLWGDPQYDQDHRGFWGSSSVPGTKGGRPQRFRSRDIARSLLEQATEQHAIDYSGGTPAQRRRVTSAKR